MIELDQAAAIVGGCCAHCDDLVDERLALLDEAGLLVTPERDAGVAAKALRDAAEALDNMQTPDNDEHRRVLLDPALWLTERADRIEGKWRLGMTAFGAVIFKDDVTRSERGES